MTPDQERWAEALAVERIHGDRAHVHVAERIGALAMSGDAAGVTRWRAIAERLDALGRSGTAKSIRSDGGRAGNRRCPGAPPGC